MTSKKNRLFKIILIIIFLVTAFVASAKLNKLYAYNLPEMGSSTDLTLSHKNEKILGEHIYYNVKRQLPLVKDLFVSDYIQKLGNKLLKNSNSHYSDFTFFVIDSPTINAFALPGGFIGVNSGLITAADSEAEIAAVLAHEITHVNQRHIARSFEKQQQIQLPMIAGLIAGALLSAYSPELGQSLIVGSMAVGNQTLINYTRANEQEADHIGMRTLVESGYSPTAMADFFNKLQAHSHIDSKLFPEYLRTHPLNESRIASTRARAFKLKPKNKIIEKDNNDLDFQLIKNMILVNSSENYLKVANNNLRAIKYKPSTNQQYNIYKFNAAYALLKHNDFEQANKLFKEVNNNIPHHNIISSLFADSFNNPKQAIKVIDKQISIYPENIPLNIKYAKLANAAGKPVDAITSLKKIASTKQNYNSQIDLLLAESYNKIGKKWHASLAYSDFSVKNGDYKNAIMQLKATSKFEDLNSYQKKILNYKIKKLEQEYQARKDRIKGLI